MIRELKSPQSAEGVRAPGAFLGWEARLIRWPRQRGYDRCKIGVYRLEVAVVGSEIVAGRQIHSASR